MATTTNYAWTTPDNSGLVKNGAQDIRTLGSSVDTSLWNVGFGQAGKNKIINGDFGVWQRGTSFSNPTNGTYTADRWFVELDGSGYTRTISQQTFTPGTAPVAGYEGTFFYRWNNSVAGTGNTINALSTRLEDIRTCAGQTITFSFWAKADASRALTVYAYQQSTGGSGTVTTTVGSATLTTSWARYTMTVAIPSLTGITIGSNSNLQIRIAMPTGVTMTCDFWGMQLEVGSTATPFQTATGTKQGELAACQRYYWRATVSAGNYLPFAVGQVYNTTQASIPVSNPVQMRTGATSIEYANLGITNSGATPIALTNLVTNFYGPLNNGLAATVASGVVAGNATTLGANNSSAAYLGFSAEL